MLMRTAFSKNKESYEDLLNHMRNFEESQELQAKQGRYGVKKEIWINEGGNRLQLTVEADQAEIHYANSSMGKEIVEQFTDVFAELSEEIGLGEGAEAGRRLKKARASKAEYHYSTQELKASAIELENFDAVLFSAVTSDDLSYWQQVMVLKGNVFLKGTYGEIFADEAEIPIARKEGTLQGHVEMRFPDGMILTCGFAQFDGNGRKAHFSDGVAVNNPDGTRLTAETMSLVVGNAANEERLTQGILSLTANGNVSLSRGHLWLLTADTAIYDKGRGKIEFSMEEKSDAYLFLKDSRGKVYARHAIFDTLSQECLLTGDVKMIHREGALEQYALADRVKMIKGEKEIRFFSDFGRRVLFYDKINKLQMSAPEISVMKDPLKNKNIVKGKGKVRFHFKDEEYERLRQYFLIEKFNG